MLAGRRWLIFSMAASACQAALPSANAGLCDWFHKGTTQTTFYAPAGTTPAGVVPTTGWSSPTAPVNTGAPAAPTTPISVGPATCEQTVVQYLPETAFRTVWNPVPVTQYQTTTNINPQTGLPVTCTRPCVTYTFQAQRVPYTTFRPVFSQVPVPTADGAVAPAGGPVVGYTPGTTAGGAPVAASGCATCSGAAAVPSTTGAAPAGSGFSLAPVPASTLPSNTNTTTTVNPTPWGYTSPAAAATVDPPGATPWVPRNAAPATLPQGYTSSPAPPASFGSAPGASSPAGAASTGEAAGVPPTINRSDTQRIEAQGGPTPESSPANGPPAAPPAGNGAAATAPAYGTAPTNSVVPNQANYRWNGSSTVPGGYGSTATAAAAPAVTSTPPSQPPSNTYPGANGTTSTGPALAGSAPTGSATSNWAAPYTPNPSAGASNDPWLRRPLAGSPPVAGNTTGNTTGNATGPSAGATAGSAPAASGWSPTPNPAPQSDDSLKFRIRPLPDTGPAPSDDLKSDTVPSLLDPNDLTASRQLAPAGQSWTSAARAVPIGWAAGRPENGPSNVAARGSMPGPKMAPSRSASGPPRLDVTADGLSTSRLAAPEDEGWNGR